MPIETRLKTIASCALVSVLFVGAFGASEDIQIAVAAFGATMGLLWLQHF